MNRKKITVSNIIPTEVIRSWGRGSLITIKAGTGAGKSYFIKTLLYAFAKKNKKKILMLIHRTNCVEQFVKEVVRDGKSDVITIMTYQKIEYIESKLKKNFDFSAYDYIVSDEFHYYLSDASFNIFSDVSLNKILNESGITRIFMSATGNYMRQYIKEERHFDTIDYELPITFDSIESLNFFNKDETIEKYIEECIATGEKAIFFIQSATKAYNLYKKYKDNCLFNCGKGDEHYKYVDKVKITNMLENERFEELILITTTCMDAGVNIIDVDLKHIICDVKDVATLVQCLGRKRMDTINDKLRLHIKAISNKELLGMRTKLEMKIKKANFLKEHTLKEYVLEYPRENDNNKIVYDITVESDTECSKKINDLMYFKCNNDIKDIETMLSLGEYGYCKYLANTFDKKYIIADENYDIEALEVYLESLLGLELSKDERKELIDTIGLKDARERLQKSITQLNAYLLSNKLNYIIISKKDNRKKLENGDDNPSRGKYYWEIIKTIIE